MIYMRTTFCGRPFDGIVARLKNEEMLVIGSEGILKVVGGIPSDQYNLEDYKELGLTYFDMKKCSDELNRLRQKASNLAITFN